jgi:hypothetical protein
MLTLPELQVLMPLLDAGIRATGLQLFQNGGGATLQAALAKLQDMADAQKKEAADGEDQHHS